MEQREWHLQPLGICYRLYHFIMKTLASQALKTVTLGRSTPTHYRPTSTQVKEKNHPSMNVDEMKGENMTSLLPQAKPPKKMVSRNDNVEEIFPTKKKKKKKRSMSFQKSSFLDQEEEKEEPKPLRSILKPWAQPGRPM